MNNAARAALAIMGFSFLAIVLMVISLISRGDIVTESHVYCMSIIVFAYLAGHAGFLYHTRRK